MSKRKTAKPATTVDHGVPSTPFCVVETTRTDNHVLGESRDDVIIERAANLPLLRHDYAAAIATAKKKTARDGKDRWVMITQILHEAMILKHEPM